MLQLHAMHDSFCSACKQGNRCAAALPCPSESRDHLQPTTASLKAAVQAHMCQPHLLLWLRAHYVKRLASLMPEVVMVPCQWFRCLGHLRRSLRRISGVAPAAVCSLPGSRVRHQVASLCLCAVTGSRSRLQWGRLCQGTTTGSRGILQEGRLW